MTQTEVAEAEKQVRMIAVKGFETDPNQFINDGVVAEFALDYVDQIAIQTYKKRADYVPLDKGALSGMTYRRWVREEFHLWVKKQTTILAASVLLSQERFTTPEQSKEIHQEEPEVIPLVTSFRIDKGYDFKDPEPIVVYPFDKMLKGDSFFIPEDSPAHGIKIKAKLAPILAAENKRIRQHACYRARFVEGGIRVYKTL